MGCIWTRPDDTEEVAFDPSAKCNHCNGGPGTKIYIGAQYCDNCYEQIVKARKRETRQFHLHLDRAAAGTPYAWEELGSSQQGANTKNKEEEEISTFVAKAAEEEDFPAPRMSRMLAQGIDLSSMDGGSTSTSDKGKQRIYNPYAAGSSSSAGMDRAGKQQTQQPKGGGKKLPSLPQQQQQQQQQQGGSKPLPRLPPGATAAGGGWDATAGDGDHYDYSQGEGGEYQYDNGEYYGEGEGEGEGQYYYGEGGEEGYHDGY